MKNLTQKLITLLLTLQIVLFGIQAKNCKQEEHSKVEFVIWIRSSAP